jgi:hypothetical protein
MVSTIERRKRRNVGRDGKNSIRAIKLSQASIKANLNGFQLDDIAERDVKDISEFTDPQDPGYDTDTSLGVRGTYEGEEPSTIGHGLKGRDGYNFDYQSELSDAPPPEAPLSFSKAYNDKRRAHMVESDDDNKHYGQKERRRGKSKKHHPESSSVRDIVPNKKVREALYPDEYAPSTHSREYLPSTGSAYGYPEYPSTAALTSSHYAEGTAIPRRDPRMTSRYSAYDNYPHYGGQATAEAPRRPLRQDARHPADPYHLPASQRHPPYSPSSSYQQGGRPVPTRAPGNMGEPYYGTPRSRYVNSPYSQGQPFRRESVSVPSSSTYSARGSAPTLTSAAVPNPPSVDQLNEDFANLSFPSVTGAYAPRRLYR